MPTERRSGLSEGCAAGAPLGEAAAHPGARGKARLLDLTVDDRAVSVPEGTTVLRAAELAGITIPSLCAHKDLTPFGGCRLCAVDIAGVRGQPLACSTEAQDGMVVTTDGESLRERRREILQLILSVHPSSCLFCQEKDECARSQTTIRKAGVSTGCRSCTNDGDCELQRVVDQVGVTEIEYPVAYRGLPVEHDDPFFDRDYNLCILCGRCVRMCREVRGASVLAFTNRSRRVLIAPAFGRSHVEAGCEFCGACVSVCPTGALADRVSKWDGRPDGRETSTCPFCFLGCRLELAHRDGSLSAARGAHDEAVNDAQLCVRGRFCLPEATHHPSRTRKPMLRRGGYFRVQTWDAALDEVAGQLAACPPGELLMLVSPDLTNEGLFAAQHFVRRVMRSNGIDSTARAALPGGPAVWSRLFSLPVSLQAVGDADAVLAAGLDTRFSFSVVGVQVRRALRAGARLVTVDACESNLARAADEWLQVEPGTEAAALVELLRMLDGGTERCGTEPPRPGRRPAAEGRRPTTLARRFAAVRLLEGAAKLAVIVGPRVFESLGAAGLPAELQAAAGRDGVTVLPLTVGTNVRGALELGALGEVLPGPRPIRRRALTLDHLRAGRRPRVLFLVGETAFPERPDCDYLVAQDLTLPPFAVDAFLPAASFAEADGTLTSVEGRVQEQRCIEPCATDPERDAPRPDWWVFGELAGRLRRPAPELASPEAVRAAIRAEVPGFPAEGDRSRRRMTPLPPPTPTGRGTAAEAAGGAGRFLLVPEPAGFRHRGADLAGLVEGLGELRLEDGARMNPADLARLGVEANGTVTVRLERRDVVLAARPEPACPRGAVYVSRTPASALPSRPVRVRVSAGDRSARPSGPAVAGGRHAQPEGSGHGPGR